MKKICFIVGNPHAFHGFFDGQLKYLSSYFNVIGISNKGSWLKKTEKLEGIKIYENKIERNISPIKDIIGILRTAKLLKRLKPDAIHTNTPKVSLVGILSGKLARIKTRIYMCHGLRYQGASGVLKAILLLCEKITCHFATHVVCVSHSIRDTLYNDKICSSNKMYVVGQGSVCGCKKELLNYNVEEHIAYSIRQTYGIPEGSFIFCFIGRIVLDKGIKELVKAFAKITSINSRAHLLVIGGIDNENNSEIKKTLSLIRETPNIHVVGWQEDIKPFVAISDVVVLPSYREGLSTTLLEAGAIGRPAITTNVTGCKDIIKDKFNGLLIDSPLEKSSSEIISQLQESMEYFLNTTEENILKYRINAKQFIKDNFDNRKLWEGYKNLYTSFIK